MSLLYGLHDRQAAPHVPAGGWCVDTIALSENPAPTDYAALRGDINWLVRVNWGYGSTGTIPLPENDKLYRDRLAHYVHNSRGVHAWIIGNEPNHEQERPDGVYITPGRYADFFVFARTLIKTIGSNHHVLPAPCAPYHANPVDWLAYWHDMLRIIEGNGGCDGIAVHAYTRSSNPDDINDDARMGPPLDDQCSGFLTYQDAIEEIPATLRHLPVYITEFNELLDGGWHDANTGVIQEAYSHINWWNTQAADADEPKIHALVLYRWPKYDKWHIEGKQGVIEDFKAAIRAGYTSPVGVTNVPQTTHIPAVSTGTPPTQPAPDLPPYPDDWDPRLTERGVKIQHVLPGAPGTLSWRVTKGRWLNEQESQGRHHFYADVINDKGERVIGAVLAARWPGDGYATFPMEDKPVGEAGANFAMSSSLNEFSFQVNEPKHPSDVVTGVGMGANGNPSIHTSTYIEWTLYRTPQAQPTQPVEEPDTPPTVPAPQPASALGYVSAPAGAWIRATPNATGDKIVAVPYAEQVRITAVGNQDGWVRVRWGDSEGWMSSRWISLQPPVVLPTEPTPAPTGDKWQRTIAFILKEEGGYTANDEGAPANFGINQGANPDLDVKNITREQAIERYRTKYWIGSGADRLDWPFCLLVMDASVQHGQGVAAQMLEDSGGDMLLFQGNRQLFYSRISQDKWQRNGKAWMARMGRLLVEASK